MVGEDAGENEERDEEVEQVVDVQPAESVALHLRVRPYGLGVVVGVAVDD